MRAALSERRFSWVNTSFLGDVFILVVLALLLMFFHRVAQPTIGTARFSAGPIQGFSSLPIQMTASGATDMRIVLPITTVRFSPRWYSIRADDCIASITIDKRNISDILPPCTIPRVYTRLNLGPFLSSGSHVMEFNVRSGTPDLLGFDMVPSALDPLALILRTLILGVFLTVLHLIWKARSKPSSRSNFAHPLERHTPNLLRALKALRDPIVFAWIISAALIILYAWIQPRIVAGYYFDANKQAHLFRGSFSAPDEREGWYRLSFGITYSWLRPSTLRLFGDDCVERLMINGFKVPALQGEVCGYDVGANVMVRDVIHPGVNTVQLTVHNAGGPGSMHIGVDAADPLLSMILLGACISGAVGLWLTLRRFRPREEALISAVIFLGITLRIFYFFATPFYVRANDVDGHIEYAHYILDNGRLPGMRETWESFQPPLYYLASAGFIEMARSIGLIGFDEITAVQLMSPILTIIGFLLCVSIIGRVIKPDRHRIEYILAILILSVLPGAIYNAGRVNNDVFVQFFMILSLYELIRCFDPGVRAGRHWTIALISLLLGIASKTNALIVAPVLALATPFVFWKKGKRSAVLLTVLLTLLIIIAYLGVYALRNAHTEDVEITNIVTNSVALNGDLIIPNTVKAYTEFSPRQVLLHPFNDAWGDIGRRAYFLEYLYKSAFFGEWGFPESFLFVARWLVVAGILCIPLGLLGLIVTLRRRDPAALVLLLYAISVLAMHGIFRYKYPFSPSQDFRYVSSVALAVATFVGAGIAALPASIRRYAIAAAALFVSSCIAFLIRLP